MQYLNGKTRHSRRTSHPLLIQSCMDTARCKHVLYVQSGTRGSAVAVCILFQALVPHRTIQVPTQSDSCLTPRSMFSSIPSSCRYSCLCHENCHLQTYCMCDVQALVPCLEPLHSFRSPVKISCPSSQATLESIQCAAARVPLKQLDSECASIVLAWPL